MKTVWWSVLFLVSFMGGHFIANQWLSPVGYVLLFLKLYITCLLGFVLLTQVIPYILQLDSDKKAALGQFGGLDTLDEDKDQIRLYYMGQKSASSIPMPNTATLPERAKPAAKLEFVDNMEFVSPPSRLALLPLDRGESVDDAYLWSRRARLTRRTLAG